MRWLFFSICSRFISCDLSASIPAISDSRPSRSNSLSDEAAAGVASASSAAICLPRAMYSALTSMVGVASGSVNCAVRMPLASISVMMASCLAMRVSQSRMYSCTSSMRALFSLPRRLFSSRSAALRRLKFSVISCWRLSISSISKRRLQVGQINSLSSNTSLRPLIDRHCSMSSSLRLVHASNSRQALSRSRSAAALSRFACSKSSAAARCLALSER